MKPQLKAELGRPVEGALLTSYSSESTTASNRKRLPCTPKAEVQLLYFSSKTKRKIFLWLSNKPNQWKYHSSVNKKPLSPELFPSLNVFFLLLMTFFVPTLHSIKVLSCIILRNISLLVRWWDASWMLDSINKAN